MVRTKFPEPSDGEQWGKLEVLQDVLQRSLSLHSNGSVQVSMTEESLYNLLCASANDFLTISVSKVAMACGDSPDEVFQPLTALSEPVSGGVEHDLTVTPISSGPGSEKDAIQFQHKERHVNNSPKSRITDDTRIFLPLPDTVCGNCHRPGHTIRDCVGPVDEDGELSGCPKCNTTNSHIYDACPSRASAEDFDYIYRYRQRKPPIKSQMRWQSFLSHECHPTTWPMFIPWSAEFSLEQQERAFRAHRMPEWCYYEYDRTGWPDAEAHYREIDPESEFLVL